MIVSIVLTVSLIATLAGAARPLVVLLTSCGFALFVVPGVLVARAALGREPGWLSALVFGPIIGFGLSSLALLLLWWGGGRGLWLLVAAPALASAIAIVPARTVRGRLAFVTLDRRDLLALLLVLLIVPLVVARPFSRVGVMLPEGKAYRAYFTADYVWRMVVVAELAKGDMPPQNPFQRLDTLHYYWLPHLFSAVEYRNAGGRASLDELLLCQSVFMDLVFVAFFYAFVRQFVGSRAGAAIGVTAAVLFTSFEGLYELGALWLKRAPFSLVRYVNIDAVVRWEFEGMPIDGLQRLLLYQPHHAAGYAIGFAALLVAARRRSSRDARVMAACGVLLATSFLISTFGALMLTSALALYELTGVIRHRDARRLIAHGLAGGIPLALALLVEERLGYVDYSGDPVVNLILNPVSIIAPFTSTFLSFGPVLLVGVAGALVAWKRRAGAFALLAALTIVCVFFYFFVDVRDHQDVYVGWRVGHLMFFALAAPVGLAVQALMEQRRGRRLAGGAAIAVLALAAAPMTAIDLYNTQDVGNTRPGPGFTWTLILKPNELRVLEWLRRFTPPDTIVQVDPNPRDSNTWAYVPAFAERRMAVGLPISMIPRQKYVIGSESMHQMFRAEDVRKAHAFAVRNRIDYLLVGPPERESDPGCEARFESEPELFSLAFRSGQVSLYRVNRITS